MQFIDIHNHGAWGIDDGIQVKEDSIQLLQQAKSEDVSVIVATPHCGVGDDEALFQLKKQRIQEFKTLAEAFDIQVYAGNEVYVHTSYKDMLVSKRFLTMADSAYLLVEFDLKKDITVNKEVEDWLYELCIAGYHPIIAHAERYFQKKVDIRQIQRWISLGCSIQVNRTSYLGLHGDTNAYNSKLLLDHGLVHFMASDAHRVEGVRVCKFKDVYKRLKHQYGVENANILCCQNPQLMIKNETLQTMVKRPSLVQRWMKG